MKKILIIQVLSLFLPFFAISQGIQVSKEEAGIVAQKFYFERVQSSRLINYEEIRTTEVFTIEKNEVALYYIFNISSGGFIAVSALRSAPPVLCYSFTGKYKPDSRPDNFNSWMSQYDRQLAFALENNALPSPEITAQWTYYLLTSPASLQAFSEREVQPLTTSTWDQGSYYNSMCPADPAGPGGHCVTGCVATTLGQLLNYFRWPDTGVGSYSYECPPYGTLSADFSNANYRWDLMENSLNHSNPEVAEILSHLGISVDMVYGPNGSGMYNHKAAYVLKTFFKFSPETQYVFRDSTSMDWDSLLVSHLDRKIPLYYAGWSVPDTNGHAFICDGYQGEGYYHFNWGWSGSYDGYFYTDNLTPGGNFFNLAQELVINAVPDTNLYTYPSYCQGQANYDALYGTIDDGSGPLYDYANGSDCNWLIAPNDSVNGIILNFLHFSTNQNDTVTVYDGDNNDAPVLGRFSGEGNPSSVTSTGNRMLISFESDPEGSGDGFLASFESEVPVYCSGMVALSEQAGTFSDGSGNWDYHNNSACTWRIMPEGASSVTLYFDEFETEAEEDVLTIFDLQTQQKLAEYSGTYESGVPEPVTSPSGKMFITFTTNNTNTANGWTANYASNLVSIPESGTVSPLRIYPNPADDRITIHSTSPPGKNISVCITDISGRKMLSSCFSQSNTQQFSIDLSNFLPGIYVLTTSVDGSQTYYNKVIVR